MRCQAWTKPLPCAPQSHPCTHGAWVRQVSGYWLCPVHRYMLSRGELVRIIRRGRIRLLAETPVGIIEVKPYAKNVSGHRVVRRVGGGAAA